MAGILVCHCHGHGPTLLLPNSPRKTNTLLCNYSGQNLTFVRGQKLLKDLSTWGIGGPCNYFTQVFHPTQLLSAIRYCHDHRLRFMIIGKGSNCLFDDLGFDGCVILNRMEWMEMKEVGVYKVGSGYRFNRLGMQCSNEGFTGLEFAAGIPGTVGGAAYMNAGANGQETANVVESIDVVTIDGKLQRFERADLMFGYRSSPFQRMPNLAAIVAVTFRLQSSTISRTKLQQYLERRRASQPIGERSAGSVFRNPSDLGIGAGELIEKAGLKGFRVGGAMISKLHANFFINANGSTSQDMLDLIAVAKDKVYQKFGVELKEEVLYVNPSKAAS
ncbi:hypothetical protein CsatA_026408 [Cannabis sativa]